MPDAVSDLLNGNCRTRRALSPRRVFVTQNEKRVLIQGLVYYNGEKETCVGVKIDGIGVNAVIDSGCPVTIVNNETYAIMVSQGFVEKDYEIPAIEIKGSCSFHITYGNLTISERIDLDCTIWKRKPIGQKYGREIETTEDIYD